MESMATSIKSASKPADSDEDLWIDDVKATDCDIYLLANPLSGSNEATAYTLLDRKGFVFTLNDGTVAQLRIINVLHKDEMQSLKEDVYKSVDEKYIKNKKNKFDRAVIICL